MSSSFRRVDHTSLVVSVILLAGACAERVTSPGDSPGMASTVVAAISPVQVTWCDPPPFTCATAAVTLTPAGGRTAIEIHVRNLQGVGAPWGTRRWGIEKIRLQLPYGTLGVFPPDPEFGVLLEQGTFGAMAPPVNGPLPWKYTVTAKVPIQGTNLYRDVILLSGPAMAGCDAPDWGITSYYRTCPDTAVFMLSAPGAWNWKAVSWMWYVGYKHDCAFRRDYDDEGKLLGIVMSPACRKATPPPGL